MSTNTSIEHRLARYLSLTREFEFLCYIPFACDVASTHNQPEVSLSK